MAPKRPETRACRQSGTTSSDGHHHRASARVAAGILNAATACRRWGELPCADLVWRTKFRREGLLGKAEASKVALPPPPPPPPGGSDGGGGGHSAPNAEAGTGDEVAGVGLAFNAKVVAFKVQF